MGKRKLFYLKLKVMGDYSDTSPVDCPKSALIVDRACQYLVSKKELSNDFTGKINALGLLATGRPEVRPLVKKLAHEIGRPDLKLKRPSGSDLSTWDWGFSNLLLTEYYLATHDDYVLPAIRNHRKITSAFAC